MLVLYRQELANTLCHQVDAEATNSKTSNQEAASLQHRCIQLEKQILEVQEDTERLQYLKQVKQKELEELENQEQDDGELVSGLLDQVAGLNDEDLMLMKLAAKDGSELHVRYVYDGGYNVEYKILSDLCFRSKSISSNIICSEMLVLSLT